MGGPTRGGGVDGKTRTVEFQKHMGIRADIGGVAGRGLPRTDCHAIVWHALSSLAGSALAAHAPVRGARGAVARGQRVERQRSGLKVTDHHRCGGAWVVARGRRGRRATNLQNKG